MPRKQSTRREFLKAAAITGAAASLLGSAACAPGDNRQKMARRAPRYAPKTQELRIAYVGTGGIGGYHLEKTRELGIHCPCFCDVDTERMGKAAEFWPMAKRYQDYREMFEREGKNFDAVMVGTPDHMHYPITLRAMQMGKHVYTQKPLTHTVWEARELAKAAAEYPVVTQMGNQGHANEGNRITYEWIRGGFIGDVLETHTWTDRPVWPQGMNLPEETTVAPGNLKWDAWVGAAPMRDYAKDAYHPFNWRGWLDFGAGALGDMACHTMDNVFWSLEPGYPTRITPLAMSSLNDVAFPKSSIIKWDFPRRGSRKAFSAFWYDGGLRPMTPPELELERRLPSTGALFIGTKATILVSGDYGESPRIIPDTLRKEIGKPPQLLERSPGHVEEWVAACKGEQAIEYPGSNFSYAGPMTETILLGNIALRIGRALDYDGAAMRFTNMPEANQYLSKEYREGWAG